MRFNNTDNILVQIFRYNGAVASVSCCILLAEALSSHDFITSSRSYS